MESETGQVPQQHNPSHRLTGRYLGGLLAVLLLLGAVRAWMLSRSEIIARDGMIYTAMAREWTSGPMQVIRGYDYHVGYPVAIVGMHGLLGALGLNGRPGTWDLSGGLVSLTASMVALAGVWRWSVKAYDRRVAIVAVLLPGLGRKWASLGADVLSDALAIAFQIWSLVLVHSMLQRLQGRRWSAVLLAAGAGLCGGLGYLVRPESLLIPSIGVLAALGLQMLRRSRWLVSLVSVATLAGVTLLVSLPYMIAIGGLSKKKDLATLMEELAFCSGQGMPLASMAASKPSGGFVAKYFAQLFEAMHPLVGVLVVVMLLAMLWRRFRPSPAFDQPKAPSSPARWLMLLYGVPMVPVLLGLYRATGYLSHRHVMMTALVLSPLVGQGLFMLAALVRSQVWPKRWRSVPITVFAAVFAAVFSTAVLGHNLGRPLHYGKGVYRQAALNLAQQAPAGTVILADSRWVSYYVAQVDPQRQVVIKPNLCISAEELKKQAGLEHASCIVLPPARPARLKPTDAELTAAGFHLWKQYIASDQDLLRVVLAPSEGGGS